MAATAVPAQASSACSAIYCLWPSASQLYVRCRRWISSLLFATLSRLVHDSFTIEHKLLQRVWLNKGGTEEDHVKLSHTPLATITKSHIMSRWQNYGMFTWKKWNHGMERKVKFSAPGLCIFLVGWTEKFIYTASWSNWCGTCGTMQQLSIPLYHVFWLVSFSLFIRWEGSIGEMLNKLPLIFD